MFRLPSDKEEKNKWIQAVPNADLTISSNTVICVKTVIIRWRLDAKPPAADEYLRFFVFQLENM